MLGTAPSFFWRQVRVVPGLGLVVKGMGQGVGRTMPQELELGFGEPADRERPVER